MEELSQLDGKTFVFASSSSSPTSVAPPSSSTYGRSSSYCAPLHHLNYSAALLPAKPEGASSPPSPISPADGDAIKAKIVSHPHYSTLVGAYLDCHKATPPLKTLIATFIPINTLTIWAYKQVGAPPDVAAHLSAVAGEFEARQRAALTCRSAPTDDFELDQFMVPLISSRPPHLNLINFTGLFIYLFIYLLFFLANNRFRVNKQEAYYHMLVKYREELARPLQEATDFLTRVESQLNSLTDGSVRLHSTDEKCGACSSEEDLLDGSGGETEVPEFDPRAEERELKHRLLKKYSGYLGSLRQELSKKKKKGKLPKDSRQKLLNWWEMHYKWPYPSETEKVALADSTGLDQKQINNWFINQRKRHWKPSEDMQFVVDSYYPPNASSFYTGGHFMGNTTYRL